MESLEPTTSKDSAQQPSHSEPTTTDPIQQSGPLKGSKSAGLSQRQGSRTSPKMFHSLFPLKQRWHKIAVGVVCLGLIILFLASRASPAPSSRQMTPGTKSFFITNRPTILFAHSIGNVHITSGADGQVVIKEERNGYTDAIQTHYTQTGDIVAITADIQSDIASDTWVDFDVSVPNQVGLSAALQNGGTLDADNLSGQITLSNTNGSISATNLTGPLTLKTTSGSIMLNHISGQLALTTQNGTIMTTDTWIQGHSTVQAATGTINFHGTLERKASALFKDSNGDVGITLPRNTAFQLNAKTSTGPITDTFPNTSVFHQATGNEARGNVGTPPLAHLTIQTTSGSITLQQGS